MEGTASALHSPSTKKKPCCKGMAKSGPWQDGTLQTEYRKEYYEKDAPQERSMPSPIIRRGALHTSDAAFDASTTYKNTYPVHTQQPRTQPFKPQAGQKENQPFNAWSTYKDDYPAKEVAPYAMVKPKHSIAASPSPFVDATTHKADYPNWGAVPPARASVAGRAVSVAHGSAPFEGLSSYKNDYLQWANSPRPAAAVPVRGANAALPQGPFDATTSYNQEFVAKPVDPPQRFKPENSHAVSPGWYNGTLPGTEYRRQYEQKEGPPATRAHATTGPSGNVLQTTGPFTGDTTYGGAYRPNTAPDYVRAKKPADNAVQTGPFDGQTTYNADYLKKQAGAHQAPALVKPVSTFRPSSARFDDTTTNRASYQNHGQIPVYRGGPQRQSNIDNGGRFEGMSTYKNDFLKWQGGERATAGKPNHTGSRGLGMQGPFDGSTTYKDHFVPKTFDRAKNYNPNYCESCDPASDCEDC